MTSVLGVPPGALTPLGIINDQNGLVSVVIDATLMTAGQVNFHPLIHTERVGLAPSELVAFIQSCGREPQIVNLDHD